MVLGRDDPELFIPYQAYVGVLATNRLSLIGGPLNPQAQNLRRLIFALPHQWGLVSQVHGRILDDMCVQFRFRSELDLLNLEASSMGV